MSRSADVTALLHDIEVAVAIFETDVIDYTENHGVVTQIDLADAYLGVETLIARLKYAGGAIGQLLDRSMHHGEVVVGSNASIEKRLGQNRKTWQHKVLKNVVADAVIEKHIDRETGERDCSTHELIVEAFDAASISGWKSTVCKPLGVNVNHYCEVSPANTNLRIAWSGDKPGRHDTGDEA